MPAQTSFSLAQRGRSDKNIKNNNIQFVLYTGLGYRPRNDSCIGPLSHKIPHFYRVPITVGLLQAVMGGMYSCGGRTDSH